MLGENQCLNIKIKHQDLFCLGMTNMSHFQPVKVVGRGSETQRLVGEKINR